MKWGLSSLAPKILSDKFVKKWAGLPPCATNDLIHMMSGLKFQSITGLYTEAHCVSHARTRLQGDSLVNKAIDSKIERESALIRKKSITVVAEQEFTQAVNNSCAQGEIPMFGPGWERQEQ